MVNLDDITVHDKYDTAGMRGQLQGFPQQCLMAWQKASAFSLPPDYKGIDKIVILGMGGSAIGGDLLRSFAADLPRPLIFVNREYSLPPFVDEKTLVIASSYSGNTEETLTAFKQALQRDCKKLVMTTGGRLQKMADAGGVPLFRIEHVSPPRAALGYGLLPLIAFMCQLGFLPDMDRLVRSSVTILEEKLQSWGQAFIGREKPGQSPCQATAWQDGGDLRRRCPVRGGTSLGNADQRKQQGLGFSPVFSRAQP